MGFKLFTALIIIAFLLSACGNPATPPIVPATETVVVSVATPVPTSIPPTPTQTPKICPTDKTENGKVQIRWFVGLGNGTTPGQVSTEKGVVNDFNKSQDKIQLTLEVVPNNSAQTTLRAEIASGNGPDIVGPAGWAGSNAFYGQYLDLAPLIQCNNFDTGIFDSSLVKMFQTEDQGTVGLPFAIYPSAIEYNRTLFDKAKLNYPPAKYGDQYTLPDGTTVDWSWDTLKKVAQLLTLDTSGKNATQQGFDKAKIAHYGFSWNYENQPEYWGAFWAAGSELVPGGSTGSFKSSIPQAWKDSWAWMYDGIWGPQPFIANTVVEQSPGFNGGNPFNSGKVAMTIAPSWYLCCMNQVRTWDFAAMPTYNGKVGGRIDADTLRILKSTKNPNAAFQVLAYLVTTGVQKLIVGSGGRPPAFSAVPAIASERQQFLADTQSHYSWVKNFATLMDGLQYPDIPNAEGYVPNFNDAWNRNTSFGNLLTTQSGLDLASQEATLESDLTAIYNQ